MERAESRSEPRYAPADLDFAAVREVDLPLLRKWLLRPHVAEWWGTADALDELRADYIAGVDEPNATRGYIVSLRARPIGFIQSYVVKGAGGGWWESETDQGARGIDQFLAEPADLGKGLGTAMIGAFVARLFDDPGVTVVQTDPDPANARAIRCYARAGFRPVGVVETPGGPALLMRCRRPRSPSRRTGISGGGAP